MKKRIRIALAGNPNVGKSTIFNALTGSRQHVGNWPGVTVERKSGFVTAGSTEVEIIDLPGTYSLTAYSLDEIVAREYIVEEKPDVVIHVIDTTNFERNLYLTTQLMELGVPLVIAMNMSDEAEKSGTLINRSLIQKYFGIPAVRTVGSRVRGSTSSCGLHLRQRRPRSVMSTQWGTAGRSNSASRISWRYWRRTRRLPYSTRHAGSLSGYWKGMRMSERNWIPARQEMPLRRC
jgi:small GTP-binding protein